MQARSYNRSAVSWFLASAAVMLCVSAQPLRAADWVRGVVPDWNQPYWHGMNGPNGGPGGGPVGPWRAWCTPTSAANVIGYWQDRRWHPVADGAVFPASGAAWPNWPAYQDYLANGFNRGAVPAGVADDLGWYMDTNRLGDPAQGNGAAHIGTKIKDISRAGLGLNKFFVFRGAVNFRAFTQGVAYADGPLPVQNAAAAWTQIVQEINADRPVMVCFSHWKIAGMVPPSTGSDLSPEGSFGWTYYLFQPLAADPWGNGEQWNSDDGPSALGHYVTTVGYITANTPDDIGPANGLGPTNWIIVHDNIGQPDLAGGPGTPRNVAVPFNFLAPPGGLPQPPWISNTVIRCRDDSLAYAFTDPEVIDNGPNAGQYVSLELDAGGTPHVGYKYTTSEDVRYATKIGAAWALEAVDASPGAVTGVSLALTSTGYPKIAYTAGADYNQPINLKFATRLGGGAWSLATVWTAPASQYAASPSLVLTSGGLARIAYLRWIGGGQPFGVWLASAPMIGDWIHTQIDANNGYLGGANAVSLAIDGSGSLYLAYSDLIACGAFNVERLKYASNECTGSWTLSVLESNCGTTNFSVGQFPSIALGSDGRRTISHYALSEADLRIKMRAGGCPPPAWAAGAVADPNIAQGSTSVRYASTDLPVVAYWGACGPTSKCLKVSRYVLPPSWTSQTAYDPGSFLPNFVPYCSMDLDANDNPHVAFYGPEATTLRYTRAARLGDLDGDLCVDRNDRDLLVDLLLDPAAATPEQRASADCNGDGVLDGRDIQCFVDLLLP